MSVQDFSLSARIKAQICKDPVLQEEECDRLRIDLFRRIAGKPVARALRCHRLCQNFQDTDRSDLDLLILVFHVFDRETDQALQMPILAAEIERQGKDAV